MPRTRTCDAAVVPAKCYCSILASRLMIFFTLSCCNQSNLTALACVCVAVRRTVLKEEYKQRAADGGEGMLGESLEAMGRSPNLGPSAGKRQRAPPLAETKAATDAEAEPVWARCRFVSSAWRPVLVLSLARLVRIHVWWLLFRTCCCVLQLTRRCVRGGVALQWGHMRAGERC